MSKAKAELSAGLIATKGNAAPAPDMPSRAAGKPITAKPSIARDERELSEPLNFKVPQSFRRTFKAYAGAHGMKLNELLQKSFEAFREKNGE